MERERIKEIFDTYFEKYKKTEGDRTSWSAYWSEHTSEGLLELNMTKCPEGLTFKIFVDSKKVAEVKGWDEFFKAVEELDPALYDEDAIFSGMEAVI